VACGPAGGADFGANFSVTAFGGEQGFGFGLRFFDFGFFLFGLVDLAALGNVGGLGGDRVGGEANFLNAGFAGGGDLGRAPGGNLCGGVGFFFHLFKGGVFFEFFHVGGEIGFLFFDLFLFHGTGGRGSRGGLGVTLVFDFLNFFHFFDCGSS